MRRRYAAHAKTEGSRDGLLAANAETTGVAKARASMTPQRQTPTQRVVSYQSLGPDDSSAKVAYRSPFDSPSL